MCRRVADTFAIDGAARRAVFVTVTAVQMLWSKRILSGAAFLGLLAGAGTTPASRRRHSGRHDPHQRNSRGPNNAPARVHSTIVPPYQTAINGSESSVQWSA